MKRLLLGLTLTVACLTGNSPHPGVEPLAAADREILIEGAPVSEWIDMLRSQNAFDAVRVLAKNGSQSSVFLPEVQKIMTKARKGVGARAPDTYNACVYLISVMGPRRDLLSLLISELEEGGDSASSPLLSHIAGYGKEAVLPLVELAKRQRKKQVSASKPQGFATITIIALIGKDALAAEPFLLEILSIKNDPQAVSAAMALARIGGPNAEKSIAILTKDLNPISAQALGALGPRGKEAVPALVSGLKGRNEFQREETVIALLKIDPRNPELLDHLKKSGPLQALYLFALHQAEPENADLFKQWIEEVKWPKVHRSASVFLSTVKQRSAVPALQDLIANAKSESIVQGALDSLTSIDPSLAIPEHIKILQNAQRGTILQLYSVRKLASLGPSARDAVPAIRAYMEGRKDHMP